MAKRIAIIGLSVAAGLMVTPSFSQDPTTNVNGQVGTITTAVPFLRISPDARSGGMGDAGIAVSPDANAQFWNIGKVVMNEKDFGVSVTYTPWLQELTNDIFLAYLAGYKKFGENDNQAISASLRYFNLGNIDYMTIEAQPAGQGKPREFAFDIGYSRKLSNNLSTGVNLRYINSNIAAGSAGVDNVPYKPGNAVAADIGVYYTSTKTVSEDQSGTFSAGAVLSNIGPKISYSQTRRDFLPGNLGLGAAYTYKMDAFNKITGALDLNKTLAPAPVFDENASPQWSIPDRPVITGILNSFVEAPPGYGTTISVGGEYWYQDQFALRAGYFYENKNNGNRQYFTCGIGASFMSLTINVSYLVPSGSSIARNPLANTLRFSLLFDMEKGYFANKKS